VNVPDAAPAHGREATDAEVAEIEEA